MTQSTYTRLDEKLDKVLTTIGEVNTAVGVLRTHREHDCERLEEIASAVQKTSEKAHRNSKKIAWIIGVGSGISGGGMFAAVKSWFGL